MKSPILLLKVNRLFASLNSHRQEILPGGHGAGGKGAEGTGRVVSPVEIKDDPA
jgi:hypothetical protein